MAAPLAAHSPPIIPTSTGQSLAGHVQHHDQQRRALHLAETGAPYDPSFRGTPHIMSAWLPIVSCIDRSRFTFGERSGDIGATTHTQLISQLCLVAELYDYIIYGPTNIIFLSKARLRLVVQQCSFPHRTMMRTRTPHAEQVLQRLFEDIPTLHTNVVPRPGAPAVRGGWGEGCSCSEARNTKARARTPLPVAHWRARAREKVCVLLKIHVV